MFYLGCVLNMLSMYDAYVLIRHTRSRTVNATAGDVTVAAYVHTLTHDVRIVV